MKRNGFTLVEILITFMIMAVLITIAVMVLNPLGALNRGKDSRRKKDLERIRVAFEEYFSDKGCYPAQSKLNDLMNKQNCRSETVFRPWLSPWPCDPDGEPYMLVEETGTCSKWFKVLTNLDYKTDGDIPKGWYDPGNIGVDIYTPQQVNYGMSSTNVNWFSPTLEGCATNCLVEVNRELGQCGQADTGCSTSRGATGCYLGSCLAKCRVPCCDGPDGRGCL